MRPNQQNNNNKNRSRGRNNNGGRKHGNPLSRNYESNGPDVKVRGNASHIAEKYLQLARDAQSSGDSVMAENYLQHAEHYFRILSAAQPQPYREGGYNQQADEDDFDDDFAPVNDRFASPEPRQPAPQPQPVSQQPNAPQQDQSAPAVETETVVLMPVEVQAEAAEGEAPAVAEGEPRRRERRPRRRSRGQAAEGSADPAGAPQPEVGDLPAFITAGNAAAE